MKVIIKIEGMKDAQKKLDTMKLNFAGLRGKFHAEQSRLIKQAIQNNADKSYDNSPAKEAALKSADIWQHNGEIQQCNIMAPAYANYRQYGCGGLKIVELVKFTEKDKQALLESGAKELLAV